MNESRPDRVTLAAWVAAIVIGGGNAVGVRFTVFELDPFWAAAIRFLGAGLVFAALMLILRPPIGSRSSLIGATLYGVVGFGAQFAFLYWGLQEAPAGTAQVLIALAPLATFGLAIVHGLERFRWRGLLGSVIALSGVAVVFTDQLSAEVSIASLLAIVAGALCIAEAAVIVKLTPRTNPIVTNTVGMIVGGVLLAVLSVAVGERWTLPQQTDTWSAVIFLIVGGSVGLFALYVFVLGRWTASATSYMLLLWPLATIVYSAVLLDESITPAFVVGGTIVLAGVWIGALAPERRPTESPAPDRRSSPRSPG
jgi:drug/metabolite transporter (DMT)-like permease